MTNKLSESFIASFGKVSDRLNKKQTVSEETSKTILERKISEVNARINSARMGGVGHIGKLTEERARLQGELASLDETVKFNGRTFNDYKTFNSEKEANKFLEKNDDYGVIGEKGGKVYCAKMKDMGEELEEKMGHIGAIQDMMRKEREAQAEKLKKKKATKKEELDPVGKEDKDIDNDGDVDSSDKYLHKRRKAISKAMKKQKNESVDLDEKFSDDDWVHIDRAGSFYNPKKDTIIGYSKSPKDPNRSPKIKAGANAAMRIGDAKKKGYAIQEEVALDEGYRLVMTTKDGETMKSKVYSDKKEVESAKWDAIQKNKKQSSNRQYKSIEIVKEEVELDEGYTINHKTFSSAVQHAKAQVEKQGYTIDDDEWDRKVAMGPRRPGKGKTNRYTIELMKDGKPTKRMLQMQVYYDEGRYELNMYVS